MTKPKIRIRSNGNQWIFIVLLMFAVVYACSLTLVYIDCDDAISIAYHALGRDDRIQPPFERFQSGMDTLLSLLPPDEPTLRVSAMVVSAFAAAGFVLLTLLLSFKSVPVGGDWQKIGISLAFLLSAPELLYMGLLYTPMLMGMCFAVSAHLLLRRTIESSGQSLSSSMTTTVGVSLSSVLMGVAGFFRWDVLAYGIFVALDIALDPSDNTIHHTRISWRRSRLLLPWGGLALCIWLALVIFTGDFSKAIADTVVAAHVTSGESRFGAQTIGAQSVFFTPAFLVAGLAGWIMIFLKGGQARWFVVLMSAFSLLWPFWATPKEIMVFIPFFAILFVFGMTRIVQLQMKSRLGALLIKMLFVVVLLFPWVIGVQMFHGDSPWGPGFELRRFDHPVSHEQGIRSVRLVIGDGAALPTNEGIRPVFGHAAVLFGGKWRAMATQQAEEHAAAFMTAIQESLPYLVIRDTDGFQVDCAARMGYTTIDPELRSQTETPVVRLFKNASGQQVVLVHFQYSSLMADSDAVLLTARSAVNHKVVAWAEPGLITKIFRIAPGALQERGFQTVILDLQQLAHAIGQKQRNLFTRPGHE